jgi:hypothetical protein
MNIRALETFVEQQNRWRAIFGKPALSLLSAKDRQYIAEEIDCQLSPENLSCDGEITPRQAQEKYRYLTRCARELLSVDPAVKFYEYAE